MFFSLNELIKLKIYIIFRYWLPNLRRSGEGNGNPLQYSCLGSPMDRGAWWAAVHGIAKSQTGLSDFTFTFHFHTLEKEMATHSSILAWRIPGTGGAWWATVYGVAQSQTRLKRCSSSSLIRILSHKLHVKSRQIIMTRHRCLLFSLYLEILSNCFILYKF